MSVSDDDVVAFDGSRRRAWDGLAPDSEIDLDGTVVRTLPRPGELLCRFATVNDVHFGETCCGLVEGTDIGPVFRAEDGSEPYPELMNRGAVAEIAALDPAAVVAKGDLTSSGTVAEYERFLECYGGAFGDRLHHVRGNHDAYHGEVFADWPAQEIALPGVRLALLDTARLRQVNGSLSGEQLDWLDELAARSDEPVLVFGHHNMWSPDADARSDDYFGVRPGDAEALLAVFERRSSLVGYFAGHTHRNRRIRIERAGGVPWVEVGCVKDYPGTWAEYRVHDGGILQVARRVSSPEALAWTEQTRHMFEGGYAAYALGRLADRCFPIWPRTA
jgi:3',5'-cyclic AMP phosphodiesterase CpdA